MCEHCNTFEDRAELFAKLGEDYEVNYCPYCGEAFIRKGNHRRRYCTKVECQRARKNKNTIACRERQKASMGQNKKANENTTNPNQD